MSNYYRTQRFNKPREPQAKTEELHETKTHLCGATLAILKAKSEEMKVPISRLLSIALDNELDVPVPFNYPCAMPEAPFVEDAFIEEAIKLFKFIEKFPYGIDKETLMLCRREYGILKRSEVMYAYRELLHSGMIEEFKPRSPRFQYDKEYRRVRAVPPEDKIKKNRYKPLPTLGEET